MFYLLLELFVPPHLKSLSSNEYHPKPLRPPSIVKTHPTLYTYIWMKEKY